MISTERVKYDSETCMTMRHNWGYDKNDEHWKSPKDIIENLVLSSSRGVNFLLNVGPTPEGTLLPEEIERLEEVGEWMKVNGESVYGTNYAPVDFDFHWGDMTTKENKIYLHVLEWTPKEIKFNGIIGKPSKAYYLADKDKKSLKIKYNEKTYEASVEVSNKALDKRNTVIVLEYDKPFKEDLETEGKYHWYTKRSIRHINLKSERIKKK